MNGFSYGFTGRKYINKGSDIDKPKTSEKRRIYCHAGKYTQKQPEGVKSPFLSILASRQFLASWQAENGRKNARQPEGNYTLQKSYKANLCHHGKNPRDTSDFFGKPPGIFRQKSSRENPAIFPENRLSASFCDFCEFLLSANFSPFCDS